MGEAPLPDLPSAGKAQEGTSREKPPHGKAPPQSVHAEPHMAGRALHHARSTGDILLIKSSQSVKGVFGNLNVDTTVVKLALCVWLHC